VEIAADGRTDFATDLLAHADFDGSACPRLETEDCHNGCDDDENGFTDADDPACTPQILATPALSSSGGAGALMRLLLLQPPVSRSIEEILLLPGAFPEYQHHFANSIFFGIEGGSRILRTVALGAGGTVGRIQDVELAYRVRDVCIFHGELIILGTHSLHRFNADGRTEMGTVDLASDLLLTSCTSDGAHLYLAAHDLTGRPSTFEVLDEALTLVGAHDLPAALIAAGYDRCLDFTWLPGLGFLGLFAMSNGELNDGKLNAKELIFFDFDGGVGNFIDAGPLHSIGSFRLEDTP
jgi:hypothetical protein